MWLRRSGYEPLDSSLAATHDEINRETDGARTSCLTVDLVAQSPIVKSHSCVGQTFSVSLAFLQKTWSATLPVVWR